MLTKVCVLFPFPKQINTEKMASPLACEKYWADKANIDGAEKKYYECLAQVSFGGFVLF